MEELLSSSLPTSFNPNLIPSTNQPTNKQTRLQALDLESKYNNANARMTRLVVVAVLNGQKCKVEESSRPRYLGYIRNECILSQVFSFR